MAENFHFFNFSWVDILVFGATLYRICIVEEILVELILVPYLTVKILTK